MQTLTKVVNYFYFLLFYFYYLSYCYLNWLVFKVIYNLNINIWQIVMLTFSVTTTWMTLWSLKGSDSHMMNVHVTYQKDVFNVTSFPDSLFMKNISKLLWITITRQNPLGARMSLKSAVHEFLYASYSPDTISCNLK